MKTHGIFTLSEHDWCVQSRPKRFWYLGSMVHHSEIRWAVRIPRDRSSILSSKVPLPQVELGMEKNGTHFGGPIKQWFKCMVPIGFGFPL